MYGTVMRFDPSEFKPYKMYDKDVYFGMTGDEEKKILAAREEHNVESNNQLPNEVTVKVFPAKINELKEFHYVKSDFGTTINKYELVLDKSIELEIRANEIDGLWYQG